MNFYILSMETAEKKEVCLCLNDQGGERMDVSINVTATLRAGMSGHPPLVMGSQQGNAGIGVDLCPTLTEAAGTSGNNQPILRIMELMPDIRDRMRWHQPCLHGMGLAAIMFLWSRKYQRVTVLPATSLTGRCRTAEMVWDVRQTFLIP